MDAPSVCFFIEHIATVPDDMGVKISERTIIIASGEGPFLESKSHYHHFIDDLQMSP